MYSIAGMTQVHLCINLSNSEGRGGSSSKNAFFRKAGRIKFNFTLEVHVLSYLCVCIFHWLFTVLLAWQSAHAFNLNSFPLLFYEQLFISDFLGRRFSNR